MLDNIERFPRDPHPAPAREFFPHAEIIDDANIIRAPPNSPVLIVHSAPGLFSTDIVDETDISLPPPPNSPALNNLPYPMRLSTPDTDVVDEEIFQAPPHSPASNVASNSRIHPIQDNDLIHEAETRIAPPHSPAPASPQIIRRPQLHPAPNAATFRRFHIDAIEALHTMATDVAHALRADLDMRAELMRLADNGDPDALRRLASGERSQASIDADNMIAIIRAGQEELTALGFPGPEAEGAVAAEDDPEPAMIPNPEIELAPVVNPFRRATTAAEFRLDSNVRCIVCNEQTNRFNVLQAPCRHIYCSDCFRRFVEASTRDESIHPPRCCGHEIPLSSGQHFLNSALIELFHKKTEEYSSTEKTYCVRSTCSTFIPLDCIRSDIATCPACHSETCSICKGLPHIEAQCPVGAEEHTMNTLIKENLWAVCPNCSRIIELGGGCNHMT